MPANDLSVLCLALRSLHDVDNRILDFYRDNPEAPLLASLDDLYSQLDALDRLLHVFACPENRMRDDCVEGGTDNESD